jgi:L-lactate dehydrogenase complex protein LldG
MSARDEILSSIRRSLGVTGREAPRRQVVADRLERSPKGLIPTRGQLTGEALLDLFRVQAEGALATVALMNSPDEVPGAVAEYLRSHNLPAAIRMGEDPRLSALPWGDTSLEISHGVTRGADLNGVSHAFGGVAETGTIVMVSGPENPSTLNFLPDNHIVVVSEKAITGDYETMWSKIRLSYGKGTMPRTVNWITGPSRSADIEQTILLGAHGPRRLHIVVVQD